MTGALTRGGSTLAVDGVLLIGEHGSYPLSKTGQVTFPKRRLFSEILEVFDHSGRIVPVYTDKHLSDNWEDAKWLYDSARRRDIPLHGRFQPPGHLALSARLTSPAEHGSLKLPSPPSAAWRLMASTDWKSSSVSPSDVLVARRACDRCRL